MEELNVDLLKKDLLENGMVSEVLPSYFNTNGLSKISFKELVKKDRDCSPITFRLLKKDGGTRMMYLPNPIVYQQCINIIFKNKDMVLKVIDKIENNKYSQSKIIGEDYLFDIPIKNNPSKYIKSLREKMYISIGKKYKLKYDIEKFYDNIYTHYLPAGLIGLSKALEIYKKNEEKSEEYSYMCLVDEEIRSMNNKETKGIITGPYISRIVSELLLAEIDNEICSKINSDCYRRYVDDGEIYLNTLDEAEKDIETLKNIFQKYKLSLKMEKTEIKKIPYFDFNMLKEIINIRKLKNKKKVGWYFASQDDFFGVIAKAEEMEKNGKKGALKYILKVLTGSKYEYGINKGYELKDKSFFYLLNYLLIYPQYSNEILKLIDRQIEDISESGIILNEFLKKSIENKQELVGLFVVQILKKHQIKIDIDIIVNYLLKDEDSSEILKAVFLAYLCDENNDGNFDSIIKSYRDNLKGKNGFNFKLESWLSQYVLFYYDFITENEFDENQNFIKNLIEYKKKNIKFIDFSL